jgi:hypothetical protein
MALVPVTAGTNVSTVAVADDRALKEVVTAPTNICHVRLSDGVVRFIYGADIPSYVHVTLYLCVKGMSKVKMYRLMKGARSCLL